MDHLLSMENFIEKTNRIEIFEVSTFNCEKISVKRLKKRLFTWF